jgi:predicted glycosyl hydrolase (DUF1957 family)
LQFLSRSSYQRLEDSHLPLVELLQRLTKDSLRGTITVELDPDVLQDEDEALVQTHLRRAA